MCFCINNQLTLILFWLLYISTFTYLGVYFRLEQKRKETEEQQALKDLEKLERRKMDTMRRLKEQQVNASSNNKSSLKAVTSVVPEQELKPLQIDPKLQKHLGTGGKPLSKSSSGQVEEPRKQTNERPTVANKQITKSKSTSSVPTQVQKTSDVEKKVRLVSIIIHSFG